MEKLKTILDLALGDGHIPKPRTENCNTHLRMNHSIKQSEYLLYKKKLLEDVGIESTYRESISKSGHGVCYLLTRRYPVIKKAREILYENGKKVFSKKLLEFFDERSLSFLFQDDGSKEMRCASRCAKNSTPCVNNFVLNVQSFDQESLNNLSNVLKETLIDNKVYKRKGYFVITIAKYISKVNLVEIIKPYVHKSMIYKIEDPLNSVVVKC
mgnify:CR=1 FL=1|tara:strand:- start:3460 stop:4095 length:636 start_codon:yes stop_codon:yes gene_type:complete